MWLLVIAFIVGPLAALLGYVPWWITRPDSTGSALLFGVWYTALGILLVGLVRRAWCEMRRRTTEPDPEVEKWAKSYDDDPWVQSLDVGEPNLKD
jgi:uncharacterized membrane protein YedE/YeeE